MRTLGSLLCHMFSSDDEQSCNAFVANGDQSPYDVHDTRLCARYQAEDSAYCWQHTETLRKTARSLNTTGESLSAALLQHLSRPCKTPRKMKRPPSAILKKLKFSVSGPSLGALELPLEVVQRIVSELSLHDLQTFKALNSRAHSIVVSSLEYRNVITHASYVVATLYQTDLASAFPLIRIHDVLTQARCTICGRFGGFVSIPGLQRCCERCARFDPQLIPLKLNDAIAKYKISSQKAEKDLPKMLYARGTEVVTSPDLHSLSRLGDRSLTPKISDTGSAYKSETLFYLVSPKEASRVGRPPHNPLKSLILPYFKFDNYSWLLSTVPMPHLDMKSQAISHGYRCKGCTEAQHRGERVWPPRVCAGCQISLPDGNDIDNHTDRRKSRSWGEIEWPISEGAISCKLETASGRLYTKDELLDHLAICGEAQTIMADLGQLDLTEPEIVEAPRKKRTSKSSWGVQYPNPRY